VVGRTYSVQLFALDDRNDSSAESSRQASFQHPKNPSDVSATFLMGDNVFVIGTFTAPPNGASTNVNVVIQENLPTGPGYGNINALVVRALPPVRLNSQWQAGGQLQLQWSQGTLLEATNLSGPWVTNPGAAPYNLSPTNAQKFFKVRVQ